MPMVLNNSGDYPYWEYKPSPEEQAAYDQQFFSGLDPNAWHEGPNTGPKNFMERLVSVGAPLALGAMAGYGALGASGLLGSELAGGGAGSAASDAASWLPSSVIDTGTQSAIAPLYGSGMSAVPGTTAAGISPWEAINGFGAAGSGWGSGLTSLLPTASWNLPAAASGGGGSAPGATTNPTASKAGSSIYSQIEQALGLPAGTLQAAGGVVGAAAGGGGSSTGGLLGAGIGGLLGYLDAKNQPDSLTIKNEIDPRLANLWYGADGTGGIAGQAANVYASQQGQPNPLMQAGQQISGMAGQTPDWATLVSQAKGQWDSNPWVQQQQDAITNKTTQNLLQNIMPNIGSGAESVGGYGGSRQGIAQGLAISNMNTDLAPALANLASNAYENSQNRALSSAQSAGSYGLNNQAQQAGLLGTGATMQSNAPWANLNNFRTAISGAPGNSSTTTPLFNNTTAGALGGANLGSQIGGGINWSDLFKTIGGWNWPFGSQNTTGVY